MDKRDFISAIKVIGEICEHFNVNLGQCKIDAEEGVFLVYKPAHTLISTKYPNSESLNGYSSCDFDLFCKARGLDGMMFFETRRVPDGRTCMHVVFSMMAQGWRGDVGENGAFEEDLMPAEERDRLNI